MSENITSEHIEIRRQSYKDATLIAMNELDKLLPEFNKITERVALLRKFVTAGVRLSGGDIRDIDSKYVNQWETEEFRSRHSHMGRPPSSNKRR